MKSFIGAVFLILWLSQPIIGWSQAPAAAFSLPSNVCLTQSAKSINTSTHASRYEWDACQGDLVLTPTVASLGNVPGNIPTGMDVVFDGQKWFGFVASRETSSIIRLDFGNDLTSMPASLDLGNIGGVLGKPIDVKIVKEGNDWYGFVYSQNASATDPLILRIKFGTSLENTTTLTADVVATGSSGVNAGFDMVKSSTDWIIVYSSANSIGIIRLTDINAFPTLGDLLDTGNLVNGIGDVKLILSNGQWFGYFVSYGSQTLHRLSFGGSLFVVPTDADITGSLFGPGTTPYGLDGGFDNGNFYLMVSTLEGNIIRINLGSNLVNLPVNSTTLAIPALGFTLKIKLLKYQSQWTAFTVLFDTGQLFELAFPKPTCQANPSFVEIFQPVIQFNNAGTTYVTLRSFDNSLNFDEASQGVTVSTSGAPTLDFQNQNVCATFPVNFSAQSDQILNSQTWDFGDGNTSNQPSPSEIYTSAGNYTVTLFATSSNGCSNYLEKQIAIYNAPVANFTLPSVSTICTNQQYLLSNTSSFDAGANPTWEWRLNGTLATTQKDFTALFSSATAQEIRLKALIPGCESEIIKNISTVTAGPVVDFSVADNCQGIAVPFANNTTGADAGISWNFGDGSNATITNPSHTYAAAGTFQVSLTGNNVAGCQNITTKPLKIYSKPQPDFTLGLPPFSCANASSPFQNTTPPLPDSNIQSWGWQFGDTGTSTQQAPAHTYLTAGTYSVSLMATSDKGCISANAKQVIISNSPAADFAVSPACVNQVTKFTDLSSGAQSLVWQIASFSSTASNPGYTFTSTGNFTAALTATGANGCSNIKTKIIAVPLAPTLDFSISNACAGGSTTFTDVTASPSDVVVGWNWNFNGNSSTGNPASFTFMPDGTYNVKMTTSHNSGCKYTLSRNVLINPGPTASFTATPDRGSAPLTVQFINTSQGATQYAWKFYDKVIATSSSISPVYTFAALGDYSAELTATNAQGCSDKATLPIKVLVPVIDLIMKDFSLATDPSTGRMKCVVTIFNNSNIPVNTAEISVFLSDKSVANELLTLNLNPGQSVASTLSFTVSPKQFDLNFLCVEINADKDIQKDNNKRCINFTDTDYFFNPYPNPTSGTLHVDWIAVQSGTSSITIYDNAGRTAYHWEPAYKPGLNQTILDLSFLTAGLYYVRINTVGAQKTMRFVRQ